MPRPKLKKKLSFRPKFKKFYASGARKKQNGLILLREELEAIKLKDFDGLDQTKAARKMGTSQSTFQRILVRGRKKIANLLVKGSPIEVER